jgi:hypothetical protein
MRQKQDAIVSGPLHTSHPELYAIAERVFWWLTPEQALQDPLRFAAQVMTFANWDEAQATLAALGESTFREVLRNPPAGVFDARSWNYWHLRFGISPVPALPKRKLP